MMRFSSLCTFIAAFAIAASPRAAAIIGGQEGNITDFPYLVSVQALGAHVCGGAIVDSTTIITAATCVSFPLAYYTVRVGSSNRNSGGQLLQVSSIRQDPRYNSRLSSKNVALLTLGSEITIDPARPIKLAETGPKAGDQCTVSGWGTTKEGGSSPSALRFVQVQITETEHCKTAYQEAIITSDMFCAGTVGKDACQGDAGGPLTCNGVLSGIASWGAGCGRAGFPGVYTNVSMTRSDFGI